MNEKANMQNMFRLKQTQYFMKYDLDCTGRSK